MTAEILDVEPDEYHARPEFSQTTAKTLLDQSPAHAKALRDAGGKDPTSEMDFGQVVHTLALGKGKRFEVLDYDDFRTKDAKADRDAARAAGKVPILAHAHARARCAADKVIANLADRGIVLDGQSELAVTWTEQTEYGPVACRGMFDHVWLDRGRILDLKITGNASPSFLERNAENMGYAMQEAAYRRAMRQLLPSLEGREEFLFAFNENEEPFEMNLVKGSGAFRELGEKRWLRAVTIWAACIKTGKFPAYGRDINVLHPPPWALAREVEADGR